MKTFEVTITRKWAESGLYYVLSDSHKKVAERLENKNKRIMNKRYRQIEKTGEYYRISDMSKGGKSLIYELI